MFLLGYHKTNMQQLVFFLKTLFVPKVHLGKRGRRQWISWWLKHSIHCQWCQTLNFIFMKWFVQAFIQDIFFCRCFNKFWKHVWSGEFGVCSTSLIQLRENNGPISPSEGEPGTKAGILFWSEILPETLEKYCWPCLRNSGEPISPFQRGARNKSRYSI